MTGKALGKGHARPPQLNKFMHPRNPYKICASFKELAISYPDFRQYCTYDVKGKVFLDFKNKNAVKALSTSLLDKDFGLKVEIPDNRLVPTLPLRLNYLLWIEDLLSLVHPRSSKCTKPIIGIDIGTGAACIYPLLGCKKFGWNFVATETDSVNLEASLQNVQNNGFQDSIIIKKSSQMLDVLKEEDVSSFIKRIKGEDSLSVSQPSEHGNSCQFLIDFTMCNPPFYSSEAELDSSNGSKKSTRSEPVSVSTGSPEEKITEGGEVAFVSKMIEMSLQYKDEIRIFSTLIGIKNNVKPVMRLIREKAEGSFVRAVQTEFCQGRTMRWGVAWTFRSEIPLEKISSAKKKLTDKPFVLHIPRSYMSSYTVQTVWTKITTWLKEIKIKPQIFKESKYFVGATIKAYKPTWLHLRQKKRKKNLTAQTHSAMETQEPEETAHEESFEDSEETPLGASNVAMGEDISESDKRNLEDSVEEKPSKRPKLDLDDDLGDSETDVDFTEETNFARLHPQVEEETVSTEGPKTSAEEQSQNGPDQGGADCATNGNSSKTPCFLVCSLQLKLTEALISIEMKYLGGVGKKDAAHGLLQYLQNRLKMDSKSVTY